MDRAFDEGLRGRDIAVVEAKVAETEPKADLRARIAAEGGARDAHTGHKHG
jgi:hypothetical protein